MMRRAVQAAVLVAALVLTSGCAVINRAGAVAVVEGERYSEDQIARDFASFNRALGSQQKPGTMDEVNQNFINAWVTHRIAVKAADELGVELDRAAVSRLRHSLEKQAGGKEAFLAFAATRALAPKMIWPVLVDSVLIGQMGAKLVGGTDTNAQNDAAMTYLSKVGSAMDIEVAPRFGKWDQAKLVITDASNELSTLATAR